MTIHSVDPPLTARQAEILAQVQKNGYVTIEALATRFGVSAQTVRRDIITLSEIGLLQRFHGGAGPVETVEAARLGYGAKREIHRPEKTLVGRRAAALVPDGSVLFLDVGTTIEACARELSRRPGFVVFTNSMPAAMCFDPAEHQVFVLGGRMAGRDGSLVGDDIVQRLRDVNLDFALVACSAVDPTGRVMDFDLTKIAIKRAAMESAGKRLLLATRSKFNRTALAVIADRDQFDAIVTDGTKN